MRKTLKDKKACPRMRRGSMLVGVLIIMVMVSAISLAIVRRSTVGTMIVTDSRKGYSAYQDSDSSAEGILSNKIKALDSEDLGYIPENKLADFCTEAAPCVDNKGKEIKKPNVKMVSEISQLQQPGSEGVLKRAVSVPVPDRIPNGGVTELEVKQCDGANICKGSDVAQSYNKCDFRVSWKNNGVDKNISGGYEIRRSLQENLNNEVKPKGSLENGYGWRLSFGDQSNIQKNADKTSFLVKNGDSFLSSLTPDKSQYGRDYWYALKVKNKNNFALDSLYLENPVKITLPKKNDTPKCKDISTKNAIQDECLSSGEAGPGTTPAKEAYNCCDGTECYVPKPNWIKDPVTGDCALEQCVSGDNASDCNSSNQKSCKSGSDCKNPYKRRGFCTDGSCASGWELSNPWSVYPSNPSSSMTRNQCCRQTCVGYVKPSCGTLPTDGISWTNSSSCYPNNCGKRLEPIACYLNCKSGYGARNPNPSQPSTACCYHYCSDGWVKPSCPANPSNGYYSNGYYCSESTCGEYTTQGSCNLICNSGFHKEGNSCVSNTKYNVACGTKPANTDWNSVSSITQTWNGWSWTPSTASTYNTTASTTECRYKCASNYNWNSSSCVLSTQTCNCPAKPGGSSTVWNRVSSYTQTWTGTGWNYDCGPTVYNTNPANFNCRYKCADGYTRVGSNCVKVYDCARCAKYMDHQWVVFKSTYADCSAANVGSAVGSCNTSCHAAVQPARDGCYCKCP